MMTGPSASAVAPDVYRVNWANQQNHVLDGLKSIGLSDLLLTDVTLAVDGEYIQAHKLVLSLCSSFFRDLFTKNQADKANTIVILGHVSAVNLKYLLQFIYQGHVDIPGAQVDSFVEAGNLLKIDGLAGFPITVKNVPEETETTQLKRNQRDRGSLPRRRKSPLTRVTTSSSTIANSSSITSSSCSTPFVPDPTQIVNTKESVSGPTVDPVGGLGSFDLNVDEGVIVKTEPEPVNGQPEVNHDFSQVPHGDPADTDSYPTPLSNSPAFFTPSILGLEPPPPRKKRANRGTMRKYERTSPMWKYFERLEQPPKTARCKICTNNRKLNMGSIGHLWSHLKRYHQEIHEEEEEELRKKKLREKLNPGRRRRNKGGKIGMPPKRELEGV